MPDGSKSADFIRQDSGLCSELMTRLSLADHNGSTGSSSSSDVWKEYYEQDDDGDVQLHLAIASGYLEVVNSLIRMAPSVEFLSIQNNQVALADLHWLIGIIFLLTSFNRFRVRIELIACLNVNGLILAQIMLWVWHKASSIK